MNDNIINKQIFDNVVIEGHNLYKVLKKISIKPADFMTTLTHVLMDNFCPCFKRVLRNDPCLDYEYKIFKHTQFKNVFIKLLSFYTFNFTSFKKEELIL